MEKLNEKQFNDKNESLNNTKIIIAVFLSIVIFLIFIVSYIQQSSVEVESFDNCLNETSCLYELISITNSTNLCDNAINSSRCYLSFSLKLQSPQLCFKTQNPLACILTLSLENENNYCEKYRNSTIQSQFNFTNNEVEQIIDTCNRNIEYYNNNSIEEE